MPFVLLAVVGGVALLLLRELGSAAPPTVVKKSAPPSSTPSSTPTSSRSSGGLDPKALLDAAQKGGIVGAGLLLSKLSGDLGAKLTGDEGGRIAGTLNMVQGQAVNVGRVAGKELDKALGGDGTGTTGVVAQAVGGSIGLATSIFGLAAGVSLLSIGAPVYAIFSAISDANRLAYGQKGALADFWREWARIERETYQRIQTAHPEWAAPTVWRASWPFADGWMETTNAAAFRMWMKRPRGVLGVSDLDHARFGRDRGYFVGDVALQSGAVVLHMTPGRKWGDAEFREKVKASWATKFGIECSVQKVWKGREKRLFMVPESQVFFGGAYPFERSLYRDAAAKLAADPTWKPADTRQRRTAHRYEFPFREDGSSLVEFPFWTEESKPRPSRFGSALREFGMYEKDVDVFAQEEVCSDVFATKANELGRVQANVKAYVDFMFSPVGAGQSTLSHAVYGRNEGRFEGELLEGGKLAYAGATYYFEDFRK